MKIFTEKYTLWKKGIGIRRQRFIHREREREREIDIDRKKTETETWISIQIRRERERQKEERYSRKREWKREDERKGNVSVCQEWFVWNEPPVCAKYFLKLVIWLNRFRERFYEDESEIKFVKNFQQKKTKLARKASLGWNSRKFLRSSYDHYEVKGALIWKVFLKS